MELSWPLSQSSLITISSAASAMLFTLGSAWAPSTTRRTPIFCCTVTSSSCLRRTRVCRAPTRASACAYGGARREAYHFVGRAGGIAANRDQLGDYADGDFFRR